MFSYIWLAPKQPLHKEGASTRTRGRQLFWSFPPSTVSHSATSLVFRSNPQGLGRCKKIEVQKPHYIGRASPAPFIQWNFPTSTGSFFCLTNRLYKPLYPLYREARSVTKGLQCFPFVQPQVTHAQSHRF